MMKMLTVVENTDQSDSESDEETTTRRKNEVIKLKNNLGHM